MDTEFAWAYGRAQELAGKHNWRVDGVARQLDGRWFATVQTGGRNHEPEGNVYLVRNADLGRPTCPCGRGEVVTERCTGYDPRGPYGDGPGACTYEPCCGLCVEEARDGD